MCNDYRLERGVAAIIEDLKSCYIAVRLPEGVPNVPSRQDIRMTDTAPIVKGVAGGRGIGELVNRRWTWPGQNGKAVYNSARRDASSLPTVA